MTTLETTPATPYDSFDGPDVDPGRWFYLEFPLGDGQTYPAHEPSAQLATGDGGLRVSIERFERSHVGQPLDNSKFLLLSTQDFELPEAGAVRFSAKLAGQARNATPYDYRDGFAALVVVDMASGWVYDIATNGDTVLAIHERLPMPGVENPFTRMVTDPLSGVTPTPGKLHDCAITIDTGATTVRWEVDGVVIHEAVVSELPASLKVGMGIFTLHPVTDGASTSLRGQGLVGEWRDISISY